MPVSTVGSEAEDQASITWQSGIASDRTLSILSGQLALLTLFGLLGLGIAWLADVPGTFWHHQYSSKLESCFSQLVLPSDSELVYRNASYHPIGDHGAYEHAVIELRTPFSFRSLTEAEGIYVFQLRRMQQGTHIEDGGLNLRMLNPVEPEDLEPEARRAVAKHQPKPSALIEVRYWEILNHHHSDGLDCSQPK